MLSYFGRGWYSYVGWALPTDPCVVPDLYRNDVSLNETTNVMMGGVVPTTDANLNKNANGGHSPPYASR